jgi:hypothetical protein
VLVAVAAPFSNPAARSCSSNDFGSGTGVDEGTTDGGGRGGDLIVATG